MVRDQRWGDNDLYPPPVRAVLEKVFSAPPHPQRGIWAEIGYTSLGDIKIKKLETRPFLGTLDSPRKHGNVKKCFFIHEWEISEGLILGSQE